MNKPILGIQLYTLRDFCQDSENFDSILSYLSSLGVTDVQISAIGPIEADIQKKLLPLQRIRV